MRKSRSQIVYNSAAIIPPSLEDLHVILEAAGIDVVSLQSSHDALSAKVDSYRLEKLA